MVRVDDQNSKISPLHLPSWFRQDIPDMTKINKMKNDFRGHKLNTVCESALCPNMGKCWGAGVATFMILGNICTRACRFCAVTAGHPEAVDSQEPLHIAETVRDLKLRYVVITSVARDDLDDEGAGHFVDVIEQTRLLNPNIKIEVLIPDFSNRLDCLKKLVSVKPEVVSHNIETVRRLSREVRSKALHDRSLSVLENFKILDSSIITKSSFMVGLGEAEEDVVEVMQELLDVGVDILTIGQYLAPTQMRRHVPVKDFITPETFERYRILGMEMGFKYVMSGPKVRSSYIAEEGYKECVKKGLC